MNCLDTESQSDFSDRNSLGESTKSRHSSIGGPYRNGWIDKSFPYCNPIETPNDTADSYARPLLSSGHGFPLWSPSAVSIGDVGVLDVEGFFTFFFNIFLPSYDPVQTDFTPTSFHPIQPPLCEDEIKRNPCQFPPGTVITSKGIDVARASGSPLSIKFTSVAREGGIIVLPQGADREDLTSTSRLHSYVRQNALDWYRYIRDYIEEAVPNGSLYIITGCDKVSSCGVASVPCRGGKAKAVYREQDGDPWSSSANARTNYYRASESSKKRAAIFVRGMRVSLSSISWIRDLEYHPPRQYRPYYDVLSTPVLGFRARLLKLNDKLFGASANPPVEGIPETFHPSDLISQMLLEKSHSARVAIVEDSSWLAMVDGDDATLPKIIDLVMRVFQTHTPTTKNGLALLGVKSKDDIVEEVLHASSKLCVPRSPIPSEDRQHLERIITLKY